LVRKKLVLVYLVFQSIIAVAQDQFDELTVDRPGIAEAPFTVSPGMFQLETGFDYYKRTTGEIYFLPVSLFRTGLSKAAELRITVKNIQDRTSDSGVKGISPLTVGIKTHIIEQRGWIPETDILADIIIPLGSSSLHPDEIGHDILLLFQNDISSQFTINYNVGLIWDGFSNQSQFTSSFCFNFLPTDKMGLFIEYYNFLRKTVKENGIDGGLTLLLAPMIQADISAGLSFIDRKPNHFISAGISVRIE
jgi:Putative MetA-pathway of phenol degradation